MRVLGGGGSLPSRGMPAQLGKVVSPLGEGLSRVGEGLPNSGETIPHRGRDDPDSGKTISHWGRGCPTRESRPPTREGLSPLVHRLPTADREPPRGRSGRTAGRFSRAYPIVETPRSGGNPRWRRLRGRRRHFRFPRRPAGTTPSKTRSPIRHRPGRHRADPPVLSPLRVHTGSAGFHPGLQDRRPYGLAAGACGGFALFPDPSPTHRHNRRPARPAQRAGRTEPRAEAAGQCPGWRDRQHGAA